MEEETKKAMETAAAKDAAAINDVRKEAAKKKVDQM